MSELRAVILENLRDFEREFGEHPRFSERRPMPSGAPPIGDCSVWKTRRERWLRALLRRAIT